MDKPFTLKVNTLKEEIINNINEARLPAYCIKIILKDIFETIDNIDKEEIEKYCKEINSKNKEDK